VEALKAQRLWQGNPSSIDLPSEVELQLYPASVQDNGFAARIERNKLPEPASLLNVPKGNLIRLLTFRLQVGASIGK
jgi:hypothetical protein